LSAAASEARVRAALSVSEAAQDAPHGIALVDAARQLSFADLAVRVREIRSTFRAADAVIPLVFRAALDVDGIALALAALEAGRVFLPLHPRLTEHEARGLAQTASSGVPAGARVLLATSGSTNTPKLAALSGAALVASASASSDNLGWRSDDRWLLCMPLAHAGGLSVVTRCLIARRPVVLVSRFDAGAVLEAVVRHQVTMISLVPTMLAALLEHDAHSVLSRLRVVLLGGAPCPARVWQEARARGLPVLSTYGCTEMASQVATQRPGSLSDSEGLDSGHPLSGVEIRITPTSGAAMVTRAVDASELLDAPGSPPGAISVRGPMRMLGYVGEPALEDLAWIETGDLGYLDARGRLVVLGRADDVIVTGGENVQPTEVEWALCREPAVRAALVFGVPDDRFGQVVAAALELSPGAAPDSVLAAVAHRLAPFKRPRRVVVLDSLPLGRSGKPDRRAARRILMGHSDVGNGPE